MHCIHNVFNTGIGSVPIIDIEIILHYFKVHTYNYFVLRKQNYLFPLVKPSTKLQSTQFCVYCIYIYTLYLKLEKQNCSKAKVCVKKIGLVRKSKNK